MRKLLILLVVLGVGYVLHGNYVFSDAMVQQWLDVQSKLALKGDPRACDVYAEDVIVHLSSENPRGRHTLDGGKTQICDYLMRTAEDLKAMRAVSTSSIADLRIIRREYPWTEAVVSYNRKIHILPPDRTVLDVQYADTLVLTRSLRGLKITRMNSVVFPKSQ
jgi:hypothetical protein